jgi:hypothetical protein
VADVVEATVVVIPVVIALEELDALDELDEEPPCPPPPASSGDVNSAPPHPIDSKTQHPNRSRWFMKQAPGKKVREASILPSARHPSTPSLPSLAAGERTKPRLDRRLSVVFRRPAEETSLG